MSTQLNIDSKTSAHPFFALNLNPALVVLDNVFDNGKPEAGAALVPAPGFVHPVKPVENLGQVFLVNADPGVPDPDFHPLAGLLGLYGHFGLFRAVLDGIVHNVDQGLLHENGIQHGLKVFRAVKLNIDLFFFGPGPADIHHPVNNIGKTLLFKFDPGSLEPFQPGQGQKVIDQLNHPVDIFFNNLKEISGLVICLEHFLKGFDKSLDGCQRRLEFMGHIGGKRLVHGLQPPDPGDVMEDDQGAHPFFTGVIKGRGMNIENPVLSLLYNNITFNRLMGGQGFLDKGLKLEIPGHLQNISFLKLGRRKVENGGRRGINGDDPLLIINGDHPFLHTGVDRL